MQELKAIDSYQDCNEISIQDENMLRDYLGNISAQEGRVVIFNSPNSGSLTIGLTKSYGFAEYMNKYNTPPYLIATDPERRNIDSVIEFDSGGTMTPISASKCLPIEKVIDIVVYFFYNFMLPESVEWQQV